MHDLTVPEPVPWRPSAHVGAARRRVRTGDATVAVRGGANREGPTQDRAYAAAGLAVVADGVGGSVDGGLAAEIVVATVVRELACVISPDIAAIDRVIRHANDTLEANDIDGATTVTVALVVTDGTRRELLLGWAGDSPAALISAGELRWLTVPDAANVAVAALADSRVPPRADARLTSALRAGSTLTPNVRIVPLLTGDVVVVASDGLLDTTHDPARTLPPDATATAQALADAAVACGAGDDTTVAVLAPDGPGSVELGPARQIPRSRLQRLFGGRR